MVACDERSPQREGAERNIAIIRLLATSSPSSSSSSLEPRANGGKVAARPRVDLISCAKEQERRAPSYAFYDLSPRKCESGANCTRPAPQRLFRLMNPLSDEFRITKLQPKKKRFLRMDEYSAERKCTSSNGHRSAGGPNTFGHGGAT